MGTDRILTDGKVRYGLIDSIRGICVTGMVVYHALFDVIYIFFGNVDLPFFQYLDVIRDFGAACFIFISGITFNFSENNFKRGLILSVGGLIVTGVTYAFMPDNFVIFGILTFMGAARLIFIPAEKLLRHIRPALGLTLSLILFAVFFKCNYGYIGFYETVKSVYFPSCLYRNYITAFFGFPFYGFVSGDYFGFLPWIFIYCGGYFFYGIVAAHKKIEQLLFIKIPVFCSLGRYSLYVYIIHQPVIYFTVFGLSKVLS